MREGREVILSRLRRALGASKEDQARLDRVRARLGEKPPGVIPARGALPDRQRVDLFCRMAEQVHATVEKVKRAEAVPRAVVSYLRSRNLPAAVRMGADARLGAMPWAEQKSLEIRKGPSDGDDEVGLSHAEAGIAESGTLMLVSGADNPSTINFLPDHHIIVVNACNIVGDLETALARFADADNPTALPRTINLISGPSRSGDIEQKLLLGAHGPRALHIIMVDG
jgi:L-lactate dehydrogenase complex protein LldG